MFDIFTNKTEKWNTEDKTKNISQLLDTLALFSVLQYSVYRFLQSTMFPFVYSEKYKVLTFALLVIFGGVRFLFLFICRLTSIKKNNDKIVCCIKYFFWGCISIPFIYVGFKYDYKVIIFIPITAMCLYDMDYHWILKKYVFTIGVFLCSTGLCAISGAVRNITALDSGIQASAYGIINTTDFAAYYTFLMLFIWCSFSNHHWKINLVLFVCFGLIIWAVYGLSQSRTGLLCGILTEIAILWDSLEECFLKRIKGIKYVNRIIHFFTVAAFPLVSLLFVILIHQYRIRTPLGNMADKLLSGRLVLSMILYDRYGVHLFGNSIQNMRGGGGTFISNWSTAGYGYLDVGYAMLAIRYGVVIFGIVMGLWVWMTIRAFRRNDNRIAYALAIIACHALSEARFLDINYNVLLVMPFCTFSPLKTESDKAAMRTESVQGDSTSLLAAKKDSYNYIDGWFLFILTGLIGVGTIYILPHILPWLRTIFSLQGWTNGVSSAYALIVCLCLVLIPGFLWQSSITLWKLRRYKAAAPLLALFVMILGGVIAGNHRIQSSFKEQTERWEKEKSVIQLVQNTSKEPVYVAEQEELYRRIFGGFSSHIFCTNELYRPPKGTIFTDSSTEALETLYWGGKYTAISPWSAVYSYDQAVINALTEAGFVWKSYYDGIRKCDLIDLAMRNDLKKVGDRLLLDGSVHSVRDNLRWDQFAGTYEVRYILECPYPASAVGPGRVCTLSVMGESGDKVVLEHELTMADFDREGYCDITLSYEIDSTPKVYYLITVADGVQLYLDEISWRRVS